MDSTLEGAVMSDNHVPEASGRGTVRVSMYIALVLAFWTLAVGASLGFNINRTYEHAREYARIQARTAFEKDILYRRWNSGLGGVYVKVTDATPPNPHLAHDPYRTIPGPQGTELTKLNPAYMTRLVHELGELRSGVRSHITSTNPLRPGNMADPWEEAALRKLEAENVSEIAEMQTMDGREYLRFISPLVTEASCLSCHASQGYKVGDQRGGISISVPMAPLSAMSGVTVTGLTLSHAGMWLIGCIVCLIGGGRLKRHMRERDAAEKQLRLLAEELDQRVAERTRDLRASMEEAKQASKAKSEFLANISHEVRTPLNGVLGMAELLLRTRLDDQQSSMAATIKTAGNNLLGVLNDILDFSKIEAGKMLLDPQPFSLRDAVFDAMKSLAPIAYKKNLEMIVHIAPQTPDTVVGDALRLRQVLLNLASNAIKFTARGEVVLTVAVLSLEGDHVALRFSIADTGIGIPPDKLHSIFSAFEQADSSTTRKYGGTGLGLAISNRLVSLMGGKLELESQVGLGSKFWFDITLPSLKDVPLQKTQVSAQAIKDLHVLVVDDNATNRKILLEQLTDWSMKAVESASVDEALRLLRLAANSFSPFALVLSDLQMPDKDGVDLITIMRTEPSLADIPVILLSSGDLPPETPASLYAANLTKPVRPGELLQAMATAAGVWECFDLDHLQDQAKKDAERVSETRLRVLLVEDMEMNQLVATRMLKDLGHDPAVAGNGQQALEMLARQEFDIVFMDIQMPLMDGMQATAAIREREAREVKGRHIPIAAMTAHALKGDRERYLEMGMDAYLAKPVILSELAVVIDELVRRFGLRSYDEAADMGDTAGADAGENGGAGSGDAPGLHGVLPEPIEPDVMERTFSGDAELARQSMEIYLRDAPGLLEDIRNAIDREDNSTLVVGAHTLKGLTGYYAKGGVYQACLAVERMGREKALPGAKMDVLRAAADLGEKIDALIRAMQTYIAE